MTKVDSQKKLKHEQIQYIEFLSSDIKQAKKFYTLSFGWTFTDYGPNTALLRAIMLMVASL